MLKNPFDPLEVGPYKNSMRVVSGTAKGIRLKAPGGRRTRPTADKVKEALFDMLRVQWAGCWVLDLFAGSGALGIEALSRGADVAVFVEKDPLAIRALRTNLQTCALADRARVVMNDVLRFLRMGSAGNRFDVILADPPYEKGLASSCLLEVDKGDWIKKGGILVVEHSVRESLPQSCLVLARVKLRRYGDTCVSLYQAVEGP